MPRPQSHLRALACPACACRELISSAFRGGAIEFPESTSDDEAFVARGDAVVFASHKQHCVAPVVDGLREVLVAEAWVGPEKACAHRCDDLGAGVLAALAEADRVLRVAPPEEASPF